MDHDGVRSLLEKLERDMGLQGRHRGDVGLQAGLGGMAGRQRVPDRTELRRIRAARAIVRVRRTRCRAGHFKSMMDLGPRHDPPVSTSSTLRPARFRTRSGASPTAQDGPGACAEGSPGRPRVTLLLSDDRRRTETAPSVGSSGSTSCRYCVAPQSETGDLLAPGRPSSVNRPA